MALKQQLRSTIWWWWQFLSYSLSLLILMGNIQQQNDRMKLLIKSVLNKSNMSLWIEFISLLDQNSNINKIIICSNTNIHFNQSLKSSSYILYENSFSQLLIDNSIIIYSFSTIINFAVSRELFMIPLT